MSFFQQRLGAASAGDWSSNGPFPAMASCRIPGFGPSSYTSSTSAGDLSEELWQACAGSLAYVPRLEERVWYFPQGHMEQVTASTKQERPCQELPNSGLPPQILCRVINRVLSAELDTDEVYAHISLVPEPEQSLDMPMEDNKHEEALPLSQPKSSTRLFIKILTASDTSTHGGFSVLRKHAEECLPPLDMSEETPSQELKAKDLHGNEWKFRHTYRGHPRRHLLTTGWSLFVSQKKLVAGDAVIFLRGENGELRVGIRRAKRPQSAPQAVMSSQSMHMGVVATALHALGTRTMFSVYFKPRVSVSSFLVPVEKFSKAMSVSVSVGMRFKMLFETEDASDRSFTGTIIGIEDLNAANWASSKWRSLKVDWDEANHERPMRVSPWEIEIALSSPVVNAPPAPVRIKRQRPSPSITDFSSPGSSKAPLESTFGFKVPTVLQGQETQDMGMSPFWRSPGHLNSPVMQEKHPVQHLVHLQQQHQQDMGMSSLSSKRTPFYMFSASELELKSPSIPSTIHCSGHLPSKGHSLDHGARWPEPARDASSSRVISSQPPFISSSFHSQQETLHTTFNSPSSLPLRSPTTVHPPSVLPSTLGHTPWTFKQDKATTDLPAIVSPATPRRGVSESGIKLFGISLTEKPNVKGNQSQDALSSDEALANGKVLLRLPEMQVAETAKLDANCEQERVDHMEADARTMHATRSCVKVIKKGSMVGRGIDLSRFEGYASLFEELEAMFNMKGELSDPDKGWQVAYSDQEGDKMKVGDDPWPEFCSMVRKLYIISPEESQRAG